MSNTVFFNSYKLKEEASVTDFLLSVENLVNGYMSKQQGFISFMLLADGDLWADYSVFETTEDMQNCMKLSETSEFAEKFVSFLDFSTLESNVFSVVRGSLHPSVTPAIVTLVTFKLKKDASVPDFTIASEKLGTDKSALDNECICSAQLLDGDLWADLLYWKSMEGPKSAKKAEVEKSNAAINEYLSFIGEVPFHHHFFVVKIIK